MIKSFLFLLWLLVACAAADYAPASDASRDSRDTVALRKLDDDDDPWPVGTNVYWKFEGDGWYYGEITSYSDEDGYLITWSDNSTDTFSYDDDDVDDMVDNYEQLWPIGTKLFKQFNDGWSEGEITDIDYDGAYTITWSDNDVEVDEYEDEEMDQMAHDYQTKVPGSTWPVGTKVYWDFVGDGGWYKGEITAYSDEDGYTITWQDGSVEMDEYEDEEMDEMAMNYQTMLADTQTSGTDNEGDIAAAPTPETDSQPDTMAAPSGGMKPGAVFVVVAVSLVAFVGILFVGFRFLRGKKSKELQGFTDSTPEIS